MRSYLLGLVAIVFTFISCGTPNLSSFQYTSDALLIKPLSDKVFVHVSYLETEEYGIVACNGMLYLHKGEVIVFDTPANETAALELIQYVEEKLGAKVSGVVVNHFHVDCLGSLDVFHKRSIPSYANQLTIDLAEKDNEIVPQNGFEQELVLELGNKRVINKHFGAGHTHDNIVSYIPSEEALFGGCLLKSQGAGKGNLADADTDAWPITARAIKAQYPKLKYVIPGHGKAGGIELLDYTAELFKKD